MPLTFGIVLNIEFLSCVSKTALPVVGRTMRAKAKQKKVNLDNMIKSLTKSKIKHQ